MSYVGAPDDNVVMIKKDVIQKVPNKVILKLFGVIYIYYFEMSRGIVLICTGCKKGYFVFVAVN